jgi:GNAT superfamily N-acetyltransferase
MAPLVRPAQISDSAALKALDSEVASDGARADAIDRWLKEDEVVLAEVDAVIAGYAVLARRRFHDYDTLQMLMVEESYRGQRFGEMLLRHVEGLVLTDRFFATTNLSNYPMQRMLRRLGYIACGFIDELDPGDPEIVFVKRFHKR